MSRYGAVSSNKANKGGQQEIEELEHTNQEDNVADTGLQSTTTNRSTLWFFYTSHALFMWNNRSYEFISVLLTASAFPHTLFAASIRGLSAHLASLILSPSVGRWCNNSESRLRPVQICIVLQRVAIAAACIGWTLLIKTEAKGQHNDLGNRHLSTAGRLAMFVFLILLGMIERLSAVGNLIVVERDWLPLMAPPQSPEQEALLNRQAQKTTPELHLLNATIKRIDLITKLITPLAVSAAVLGLGNLVITSCLIAIFQVFSAGTELYLTRLVYSRILALQEPRPSPTTEYSAASSHAKQNPLRQYLLLPLRAYLASFKRYLSTPTALPSLAYALEPFSVLTMAGSMSAYLLIAGFPLTHITAARTASTIVEVASTIITPLLISWLGRRAATTRTTTGTMNLRETTGTTRQQQSNPLAPLIKVGLLGLSWQLVFLIPATAVLMLTSRLEYPRALIIDRLGGHSAVLTTSTLILFTSLSLSRLGPFAFSLVEQQIVQLEIPADQRVEFSGVETGLLDAAELARWGMLGLLAKPRDFRWVALVSFGSVVGSLGLFAFWVGRRWRHNDRRETMTDEFRA